MIWSFAKPQKKILFLQTSKYIDIWKSDIPTFGKTQKENIPYFLFFMLPPFTYNRDHQPVPLEFFSLVLHFNYWCQWLNIFYVHFTNAKAKWFCYRKYKDNLMASFLPDIYMTAYCKQQNRKISIYHESPLTYLPVRLPHSWVRVSVYF